jgi:hypothetical protein
MSLKNSEGSIQKSFSKMDTIKSNFESIFNKKIISFINKSGNIIPLLKSISKHTNSELFNEGLNLNEARRYFKSNKPLGNSYSHVNLKVNLRDSHMKDLKGNNH